MRADKPGSSGNKDSLHIIEYSLIMKNIVKAGGHYGFNRKICLRRILILYKYSESREQSCGLARKRLLRRLLYYSNIVKAGCSAKFIEQAYDIIWVYE